jgi:hypothetical protein
MQFSMVKIRGTRTSNGDYEFQSMIMEKGASTPWTNSFESEYELISLMNDIVRRQKPRMDIRELISKVHDGEHYIFDVELTEDQAECLGWRKSEGQELIFDMR